MNSKKTLTALMLALCVITSVIFGASAGAEESGEGTVVIPPDTPVTYGYLETFREKLKQEILSELISNGTIEVSSPTEDISIPRGGMILLGANCELIYRGGGAAAVTSSLLPGDGISDMSEGIELFSGEALKYGHVYFASESVAEKAIIVTGGTAYFTVRGSYELR